MLFVLRVASTCGKGLSRSSTAFASDWPRKRTNFFIGRAPQVGFVREDVQRAQNKVRTWLRHVFADANAQLHMGSKAEPLDKVSTGHSIRAYTGDNYPTLKCEAYC